MKKTILLIGPYPEPIGGVSVHVKRLHYLLSNIYKVSIIDESPVKKEGIFNLRRNSPLLYLKYLWCADVVHIHTSIRIIRCLHILICKLLLKRIIVTIHSYPILKKNIILDKIFLSLVDVVIMVSAEIRETLNLKGNIKIKPAFIPPIMTIEEKLPKYIINLINERKLSGAKIFVSNAWRIDFYNSQDLYGIDMCIEMTKILKEKYDKNILFIFNIGSLLKNENKYTHYKELVRKNKLEDNFLLINEKISFVKLIEESDLVIRATNTDGDAITIREAIYLNKNVVASDVVSRPKETILFKNRDLNDLIMKVLCVLNSEIIPIKNNQDEEYYNFYNDIYYS